jgi:molecular chaperone GrpE
MTGTSSKQQREAEEAASPPERPANADAPRAAAAAEERIAELEANLEEERQHALRNQAELENYRKRMQREMAEERRYAVAPLVRDLLAVLDNLERSIEAAEKTGGSEGLLAGVRMVVDQFGHVLAQYQCTRIDAVGQPFDPNFHEAVAQEPSDEHPAGTVTRQMQVGYKLHDRVIRPAQVFVSTGPAAK